MGSVRRSWGTIRYKPSRENPRRIEASFPTPESAFEKWPGLAKRQSRQFPPDEPEAAAAWLEHQQALIRLGEWVPATIRQDRIRREGMTFDAYWDTWIRHRRAPSGAPLHPGTRYQLEHDWANHVEPYWGRVRMATVTQAKTDAWLMTFGDHPGARRNAFKLFSAMLRSASKPGPDGEEPIIPRYPLTHGLPRSRPRRTSPATPQEVLAIYRAMPGRYAPTVLFGCLVAMRIGEVCALRRGDLDFANGLVRIRRTREQVHTTVPGGDTGLPKTEGSIRDETMPPQLTALLTRFVDRYSIGTDDWLFPQATDPYRPVTLSGLRRMFDKARVEAGRPDLRFHDLRHTGLTWLAEEGATIRELMDAGGHSSPQVAMTYQHSVDSRRRMFAQRLGDKLGDGIDADRQRELQEKLERLRRQERELRRQLGC